MSLSYFKNARCLRRFCTVSISSLAGTGPPNLRPTKRAPVVSAFYLEDGLFFIAFHIIDMFLFAFFSAQFFKRRNFFLNFFHFALAHKHKLARQPHTIIASMPTNARKIRMHENTAMVNLATIESLIILQYKPSMTDMTAPRWTCTQHARACRCI